jgi:hypothetical protein
MSIIPMSNVTIHDVLENIRTSDDKTGLPPFLIKKLSNFCFNCYNMFKEVYVPRIPSDQVDVKGKNL